MKHVVTKASLRRKLPLPPLILLNGTAMKPHILWDLDGTLTDPKKGIFRCIQYALEHAGLPVPEERDLLSLMGPPIQHSFSKLAPKATEAEVWQLIAKFRERYAEIGLFENEVYAGIPELLSSLNKKKYVATSKAQVFAEKVLAHFKLTPHFTRVYGSELNGERSDKGELIRLLLEREKIHPSDAVIVGDTKFDVLGAKKAGIASIGITWGYGSRKDLEAAGADHIISSPEALLAVLQR